MASKADMIILPLDNKNIKNKQKQDQQERINKQELLKNLDKAAKFLEDFKRIATAQHSALNLIKDLEISYLAVIKVIRIIEK